MSEPPSFRERLSWDAVPGQIRDGEVRYMLIRPDALMAMFQALPTAARASALDAFHAAIETFGARSAANYARTATRPLINIVADTAPLLGWGRWTIEHHGGDDLSVIVEDSPFAQGYGDSTHPVCAPIAGMLTAVTGIMGRMPKRVIETSCASVAGGGVCRFEFLETIR